MSEQNSITSDHHIKLNLPLRKKIGDTPGNLCPMARNNYIPLQDSLGVTLDLRYYENRIIWKQRWTCVILYNIL